VDKLLSINKEKKRRKKEKVDNTTGSRYFILKRYQVI